MSLNDRKRLDTEHTKPKLIELHFALTRLKSCVSFMNSGAHPDDETSAMLAALSIQTGLDISYACANRGEGGQNDIGTENTEVLGVLRTAEMEKAAERLNLRLYWLSTHPQDSISDFGFSKNGVDTLKRWGKKRTLERFVSIIRREQPDILCPTFLDVPGQHGHHRAMTALAFEAFNTAADPEFAISNASVAGQSQDATHQENIPWQVSKLYLPAWGGGGGAYDDEVPPPLETIRIKARGHDAITGWSFENIGQHSRQCHRSQGMGRWVATEEERDWPLHLAKTTVDGPDTAITTGLPNTIAELALTIEDQFLNNLLLKAHDKLQQTIAHFPDFESVYTSAFNTLDLLQKANEYILSSTKPPSMRHVSKRLKRKEQQLARVIMIASGLRVRARCDRTEWRPGQSSLVTIDHNLPSLIELDSKTSHSLKANLGISANAPWEYQDDTQTLRLKMHAVPSNPYPDTWLPDQPEDPCIQITLQHENTQCRLFQPFEKPPLIRADCSLQAEPNKWIINTLLERKQTQRVRLNAVFPSESTVSATTPAGWIADATESELSISTPALLAEGLYELPLTLDGSRAAIEDIIDYEHINPRSLTSAAKLIVRAIPVALPTTQVAYIGGGRDRVDFWMRSTGLSVTTLHDNELIDTAALTTALQTIDTLIIGVFAFRMRAGLSELAKTINKWVYNGGHLVTLYHRPWDAWDPEHVPPKSIKIGQPSLRFRVTDENANVTHLHPDHPLLNFPNKITDLDWRDWHKERGLYFASSWHEDYVPLISMADPDEEPHLGALLCADVGNGRHIHTSLILHHQMEKLVPGSFRLMANLVS